MKLTLNSIMNAEEVLNKLANKQGLKAKTSFALAMNIKALSEPMNTLENVKNDLVRKYGEKEGEDSYVVKRDSKNFDKFVEEYRNLMDTETDVKIKKIKIDELDDTGLTPNEFIAISFMIEE
jgi:quinol monooxygenase YgiN